MLFGLLKKKKDKAENSPPVQSRKRYIYRPGENELSWRLEYRGETGYVFRGWDRGYTYKLEADRIYLGTNDMPSYIIIGKNIAEVGTEKTLFVLGEECLYAAEDKTRPVYIFRKSIDVQGTI